jgi:membrane-bound serine protease (ClpP class)
MVQHMNGFAVLIGVIVAFGSNSPVQAQQPLVDKLVLSDTIQPVTQGLLERAITKANSDGAQALLVELDTPGGLLDSTRTMVGAILSSRVPVIVYVSPAGARAGSAGFFLLEAADVAGMDPGTNAGAAHPVTEFGENLNDTMNQKVENDAEAFLRSYVTRRGRNAEAAEAAVQSSHSYTAQEALDQHLIDLVANSDAQLLASLNGREITRFDGTKVTLHLAGARIETLRADAARTIAGLAGESQHCAAAAGGRSAVDLSRIQYPRNNRSRGAGHVDGAARRSLVWICCRSVIRRVAAGRGRWC